MCEMCISDVHAYILTYVYTHFCSVCVMYVYLPCEIYISNICHIYLLKYAHVFAQSV
jgi:hypothetical protein